MYDKADTLGQGEVTAGLYHNVGQEDDLPADWNFADDEGQGDDGPRLHQG